MILLIILGLIFGVFVFTFLSIWAVAMVQFIIQTIRDVATGNISGWTIVSLISLVALIIATVSVFS